MVVSTVQAAAASFQNAVSPHVPKFVSSTVSFIWNRAIVPAPLFILALATDRFGKATPQAALASAVFYAVLGLAYFKGREAAAYVSDKTGLTAKLAAREKAAIDAATKALEDAATKVTTSKNKLEGFVSHQKIEEAKTAAKEAAEALNSAVPDALQEKLNVSKALKLVDDAIKAVSEAIEEVEAEAKAAKAIVAKYATKNLRAGADTNEAVEEATKSVTAANRVLADLRAAAKAATDAKLKSAD